MKCKCNIDMFLCDIVSRRHYMDDGLYSSECHHFGTFRCPKCFKLTERELTKREADSLQTKERSEGK